MSPHNQDEITLLEILIGCVYKTNETIEIRRLTDDLKDSSKKVIIKIIKGLKKFGNLIPQVYEDKAT